MAVALGTKEKQAEDVARMHAQLQPAISAIYRIRASEAEEADPAEPVKLLEVNEDTIPVGAYPVGFRAGRMAMGPHMLLIVELTQEEFGALQSGRFDPSAPGMPEGWTVAERIHPPEGRDARGR